MPRSLHHRWLLVYLGVFALISQLLLPTIHAQGLASRTGNPLFAAFCGEVAPQRLAALQQKLEASLQRSDEQAGNGHWPKSGCPLCASLHAAQLLTPVLPALPPLRRGASFVSLARTMQRVAHALVWLPPLRGPPRYS